MFKSLPQPHTSNSKSPSRSATAEITLQNSAKTYQDVNNRSNAEPHAFNIIHAWHENSLLLIYVTANKMYRCTGYRSLTAKFRDLVSVKNSLQINLIVIVLSIKENLIARCGLFLQWFWQFNHPPIPLNSGTKAVLPVTFKITTCWPIRVLNLHYNHCTYFSHALHSSEQYSMP